MWSQDKNNQSCYSRQTNYKLANNLLLISTDVSTPGRKKCSDEYKPDTWSPLTTDGVKSVQQHRRKKKNP